MIRTVYKNKSIGEYTKAVLDNGLLVYIMKKEGSKSSYAIYGTKYGSIDTAFAKKGEEMTEVPEGIAHFLEHKLFESEEGDTFARFAKTGAYANAFTSFDRTAYLFSCSGNFEANLDILLDFVGHPYFTPETVEKEQGIIGQEIKMYEDSPAWRVLFNLLSCLYENHPVKIDIAGTVDSIAQIDDTLLYKCYETFYNPSNMYVCIVGDVDVNKALEQIEQAVKEKKSVDFVRKEFVESDNTVSHFTEQSLEVATPLFCLGFKEPCIENQSAKERIIAGLLLEVLAGDCSPLYQRLIDEGLIDDEFSSEYFCGRGYSAFIFEGESENPEKVAKEIYKEIELLKQSGINEKLLSAAKKSAYGTAVKRFDNNEGIAMDFVDCAILDEELFAPLEILKDITADDVMKKLEGLKYESSALSVIRKKED